MYMLICSRPQSVWQHFLCKLGNNYLPHQWWRRQDLFVRNDIVCDIERVIKSFPARMLSGWTPFYHLCTPCPIQSTQQNKATANSTSATSTDEGMYSCASFYYICTHAHTSTCVRLLYQIQNLNVLDIQTYEMQGITWIILNCLWLFNLQRAALEWHLCVFFIIA